MCCVGFCERIKVKSISDFYPSDAEWDLSLVEIAPTSSAGKWYDFSYCDKNRTWKPRKLTLIMRSNKSFINWTTKKEMKNGIRLYGDAQSASDGYLISPMMNETWLRWCWRWCEATFIALYSNAECSFKKVFYGNQSHAMHKRWDTENGLIRRLL